MNTKGEKKKEKKPRIWCKNKLVGNEVFEPQKTEKKNRKLLGSIPDDLEKKGLTIFENRYKEKKNWKAAGIVEWGYGVKARG